MTENLPSKVREIWAIASLCISWVLEDEQVFAPELRAKLAVAPGNLISALASLTPPEIQELKRGIHKMAMAHSLPGPMKANELSAFLDSLSANAQFRAGGDGSRRQGATAARTNRRRD